MAKQKYWDGSQWVQIAPSMEEFNGHASDTTKHITATERNNWNSKAAGNHSHSASQVGAIPSNEKGAANGVATLDSSSKIPRSQIPEVEIDNLTIFKNENGELTAPSRTLTIYQQGETFQEWVEGYSTGVGSTDYNSDHLYIEVIGSSTKNSRRTLVLAEPLDLTHLKTINIDYELDEQTSGYGFAYLNISPNQMTDRNDYVASKYQSNEIREIISINVSGLSGLHYIKLQMEDTISSSTSYKTVLKVFDVWGEY
jgi:hypothetical protein